MGRKSPMMECPAVFEGIHKDWPNLWRGGARQLANETADHDRALWFHAMRAVVSLKKDWPRIILTVFALIALATVIFVER